MQFRGYPRALVLGAFVAALAACERQAAQTDTPAQSAAVAASATLAEFQKLRFLEGSWRGSGGAYAAFYEDYRVIDDSTIAMRSFSDSTFQKANDSSTIVFRNGTVGNNSGSTAVTLTDTSVSFRKLPATTGGYTFTRNSADQWTATLHPLGGTGNATVYVMKRVQR